MSLLPDVWTVEVGSTITKVNAFARSDAFTLVAQGFAPTTVDAGDVSVGVRAALEALEAKGPGERDVDAVRATMTPDKTYVTSSAAGGLRMTVHGLTLSMTARAAREASLGAGAIVTLVTAGPLSEDDLEDIADVAPSIILLAGGVDHGESSVVVENARKLAALGLKVPHVYAGNVAVRRRIARIFEGAGVKLVMADNVFPEVDVLNVEPVRRVLQDVFNDHITHAPGMAHVAELTTRAVLPTPGAVLAAAELFADAVGDVVVVDVGGATTDVHSVSDGSPEYTALAIDPEPRAKRTVEGDLGVWVNASHVLEASGDAAMAARLGEVEAMPETDAGREMTAWLCRQAVTHGVRRHAGTLTEVFTPSGKRHVVRGKDLTAVQWVVATGGALTRVPGGAETLASVCTGAGTHLLPEPGAGVLIDRDYLFSALGTLAQDYPDEVRATLRSLVGGMGLPRGRADS